MGKKKSLSSKTYQFSEDKPRNIKNNVIPVGPRFQADLPICTGQVYDESDTSHWLGTKVWPVHNKELGPQLENVYEVGKGRVDVCNCRVPKSSQCIKRHVAYNNKKLEAELGPAYLDWKFDEMGEDASRELTSKEKKKLASLTPKKKGEGFVEYALKALPNVRREAIVGYYFNTIVPRKISRKVKSGFEPTDISTDDDDEDEKTNIGTDDEDEDEKTKGSSSESNSSRKRSRSESKTERKYMVVSR